MNKYEAINYLADVNAKSLYAFKDAERLGDYVADCGGESAGRVPFFSISKNAERRGYRVRSHNFEHHDNAPRMPFYCDFIANHVLPNVGDDYDASGYYLIELHDTYTYLPKNKSSESKVYDNAMVFAKHCNDRMPCLVPDPFMVSNYGGRMQIKDTKQFEQKIPKIIFRGSTTGSTVAADNARLKLCAWAMGNPSMDFGITNVVQMTEDVVRRAYLDFDRLLVPHASQEHHYSYKYILSVDGNTASWDRLMWVANSQSLAMKYKSEHMLWYYPLLQEDQHYVNVTTDNLTKQFAYYENNTPHAKWIIANANKFASQYANANAATMYMARLLEGISFNAA
jgi:hypothetical protein